MCIGAIAAIALKTVVQGMLLSSEGEKLNSMNLLLYKEENVVGLTIALARQDFGIVWLLLFNSSLAYFVNLTNFLVTKHTSALTLKVLGNAKGAVAVVVSILIFRNPVSVTGMALFFMVKLRSAVPNEITFLFNLSTDDSFLLLDSRVQEQAP